MIEQIKRCDERRQIRNLHGQEGDLARLFAKNRAIHMKQDRERRCKRFVWDLVLVALILLVGTFIIYQDGAGRGVWLKNANNMTVDPINPGCGVHEQPLGYAPAITTVQAFYFSVVSVTTVGYGDFAPTTEAGRVACAVFLLLSTTAFANAMYAIGSIPFEKRREEAEERVYSQFGAELKAEEFERLTQNTANPGQCTKAEFSLRVLCWLGRVSPLEIALCEEKFEFLDGTKSGVLHSSELAGLTAGGLAENQSDGPSVSVDFFGGGGVVEI